MSQRLHHLRSSLERQHERLVRLASERPDLRSALEPVLADARSALEHLHVLDRPEATHGTGGLAGSA